MSETMEFLTLEQLCSVCALEREWLVVRVREGLIPAEGESDVEWRFTTATLSRVRRMREIERTYEAAPELAALVADMLEELDALRAGCGAKASRRSSQFACTPAAFSNPVPARRLGADVRWPQLPARRRSACVPGRGETRQHRLVLQRLLRGVVQAVDDALRRVRGRHEDVPAAHREIGSPPSSVVGTSGRPGARLVAAIASAFMRPCFTNGVAMEITDHM
jgi:chaperone modulatory protein CbpM